jgi:hypothetical protein
MKNRFFPYFVLLINFLVFNSLNAQTIISTFPFTEGFETSTTTTIGTFVQETNDQLNWGSQSGSTPTSPTEGLKYVYFNAKYSSSSSGVITSPYFDLNSIIRPMLALDMRIESSSTVPTFKIEVQEQGVSTWTTLVSRNVVTNGWVRIHVDLGTYVNKIIRTRFVGNGASTSVTSAYIAIDKLEIYDRGTITTYPYMEGFENGFGGMGWINELVGDNKDWTSSTSSPTEGAKKAYFDGQISTSNTAILTSPSFNLSGIERPMLGLDMNISSNNGYTPTLRIEAMEQGTSTWSQIFTRNTSTNGWIRLHLDISNYVGKTVQFRVVGVGSGTAYSTSISLDKLEIYDRGTITTFPYIEGFENGFGGMGWINNEGMLQYTIKNTSPTASEGLQYAYLDVKNGSTTVNGRLISPYFHINSMESPYLSTMLYSGGVDVEKIAIEWQEEGSSTWQELYFRATNTNNEWVNLYVDLNNLKGKKVRFSFTGYGNGSSSNSGYHAIDNIQIKDYQLISIFPYQEYFEANLFPAWKQATYDQFNWTTIIGKSPTSSTGPSSAYQGSQYIYIEANTFSTHSGQEAIYETPIFNFSNLTLPQLNFYYHLYGRNIGTLRVDISINNGVSWNQIWTESGNKGNIWNKAYVDLSPYQNQQIKLRFVGKLNSGTSTYLYEGDIALDAIEITSQNLITNFPYQESFETGLGDWWQHHVDQLNWTRYNLQTPTNETGPDMAFDGAYYLYLEANNGILTNANTAILESPYFDLTNIQNPVLYFNYHFYGINLGNLAIQISSDKGVTWSQNIWIDKVSNLNSWQQASIPLKGFQTELIKLRCIATTGIGEKSDIAIDKIVIKSMDENTFPYILSYEDSQIQWTQAQNSTGFWKTIEASSSINPNSTFDGTKFLQLSGIAGNSSLTSTLFDISSLSNPHLRFDYFLQDAQNIQFLIKLSQDGGINWVQLANVNTATNSTQWQRAFIPLQNYQGQIIQLRIESLGTGTSSTLISLDKLMIYSPTAPLTPPNLSATGQSTSSIALDWTDTEKDDIYLEIERASTLDQILLY